MVLTKVNSWVFMRDSYWNTKGKKKKQVQGRKHRSSKKVIKKEARRRLLWI